MVNRTKAFSTCRGYISYPRVYPQTPDWDTKKLIAFVTKVYPKLPFGHLPQYRRWDTILKSFYRYQMYPQVFFRYQTYPRTMWYYFETTTFVTKMYPKNDTIWKWLLSLLKCILRRWRHLLPLNFGWGYISRLTLFITKMYPQIGFQILDEILPFFAKTSQKLTISWSKRANFLGYIEDTISILEKLLRINRGRVTRTHPPDGVGCHFSPDEDEKCWI